MDLFVWYYNFFYNSHQVSNMSLYFVSKINLLTVRKKLLERTRNFLRSLKVSKSRKQIVLSSHTPKNQQKISHFSALAFKSGRIKKIKVVYCVK
jgi:hypothetical protein